MHSNLGHACSGTVFSTLKRAYPMETETSDLLKWQDMTQSCKGCQLYSKRPNKYWTVLPDQCVFNFDVVIDVMCIKITLCFTFCEKNTLLKSCLIAEDGCFHYLENLHADLGRSVSRCPIKCLGRPSKIISPSLIHCSCQR